MIAALVLAALAQDAGMATARVRWEAPLDATDVGEGVPAVLIVEHAAGARARLPAEWIESDYSWLELSPARLLSDSSATATRWRIDLASLEAGERELPQPAVEVVLPSGAKAELVQETRSLRFMPALFDGEDAPREPRDFRPADPEETATGWSLYALAAAALAALGAACGWWVRARRMPGDAPPGAAARLAELGSRKLDDPEVVRELYYALSNLVRSELDARAGLRRAAWTDEEWLAAVRGSLAPADAVTLEELLLSCRGAKYAAARPTEWAVREDLSRAARLLEAELMGARSAA